jgi:hypothetical protein
MLSAQFLYSCHFNSNSQVGGEREFRGLKLLFVQLVILSLALLVTVVTANADTLPTWLPGSTVVSSAGPEGNTTDITAMMLQNASSSTTVSTDGTSVTFMNGTMTMTDMWMWSWDSITVDEDPNVSFVGGFTNISTMTQNFTFSISTPIAPALASTLYGGSTSVTYGDADNSGSGGLSNDSSNHPAYIGTIDGSGVLNMLTSLNLTPAFAGDTTQSASEFQGLPGPTLSGPAATSTIGILHQFSLSAGDQATFNSSFQVAAVPEPGTIVLFATGLGGLVLRRRNRRS